MARGHEPEDFIGPRQVSDRTEGQARGTSPSDLTREPAEETRGQGPDSPDGATTARSHETRTIYEIRGRTYRLRSSEIRTMVEIGKFRAIALEDLRDFVYHQDHSRLKPEVETLIRQGLAEMKSIPHEEKGSRQLVTLTKPGLRLLRERRFAGQRQALYSGFVKPRDAHHDADLYRLYQKAAQKIARGGGRSLRVVLDCEFKKRVYHDLAKLGPGRNSAENQRNVAERHGLQVVMGKIPLPDLRIEYDTPEGERARVDIELATGHYRGRTLAEKVRAGFSIYAHAEDISNLRRVLDQHELTAEILSL